MGCNPLIGRDLQPFLLLMFFAKKNRHYGGKEDLAEGRKAGVSVGPLLKDTKESYNRTCGIDRMSKLMVHAACDSHRKAETRCGRNED